jgi:hypothetical protein
MAMPAGAACRGDCSGDRKVAVNELVSAVGIALGTTGLDRCTAVDADKDRKVSVAELVGAVGAALAGCPPVEPRLIAISRDGHIASLDIAAPWTVRASGELGIPIANARCRNGRCLVVHAAPDNVVSVVDAEDLSLADPIVLEAGSDPRDVAMVGDHTAVISQYGSAALLEIDLATRDVTPIDLSPLADADGVPEVLRLASCGRRVFAQLRRVDHITEMPSPLGAALGVIDLDRPAEDRIVDADPQIRGVQGIALARRPNFDMPVDCAAGILYVAEPIPLMQGGGGYEQVDLAALTASEYPVATGAEVGGFEVVAPTQYWLITHTEFGPGPSSHLNFFAPAPSDTYNTFADEHVNDLALDREADLLFFPDACTPSPRFPSCESGVQAFHAHSGERATAKAVDLGFPPIEVVVSR